MVAATSGTASPIVVQEALRAARISAHAASGIAWGSGFNEAARLGRLAEGLLRSAAPMIQATTRKTTVGSASPSPTVAAANETRTQNDIEETAHAKPRRRRAVRKHPVKRTEQTWVCHECGTSSWSSRLTCRHCAAPRYPHEPESLDTTNRNPIIEDSPTLSDVARTIGAPLPEDPARPTTADERPPALDTGPTNDDADVNSTRTLEPVPVDRRRRTPMFTQDVPLEAGQRSLDDAFVAGAVRPRPYT